ncbi:MAG TPA: alpha/beta hydrolase-fold protein [Burkholderiaceae bacterium]
MFRFIFIALALVCTGASAQTATPYVLEGTEVRDIRSALLGRDYQLFVSLPASYARNPERRYPVLFLTDANYGFPLVRSLARRIANGGRDVEDFILIGLSYAVGETPEHSRRRDYTVTATGVANAKSDMPGRAAVFGEAEGYRRHLVQEVFPLVASAYRADMDRKVFFGHSYGALLGAHVLLTSPRMFEHYILGSPSLWFDKRVMFTREAQYAAAQRDLPARVYMIAGALEASKNPDDDLVADMLAFERMLKSRNYPGLEIRSSVIADEDHLTVAPAVLTRGLKWAFAPRPVK